MRQLIVLLFSLICFSGFSQTTYPVATIPSPRGDSAFAQYGYLKSLTLGIDAVGDTMIRPRLAGSSRTWIHGGVTEVWKWDGTKWVLTGTSAGGGGGTVTNVSATNTYALNWVITNPTTIPNLTATLDTAKLLTQNHFYNSIDSLIIQFNNTYVKYTDTATMLSGYVRRVLAGTNTTVDNTNPQYPIVSATAGGTGTVTDFSSGNLSPLFTTSVATSTTTPALSFALSNATAWQTFARHAGTTGAPSYGQLKAEHLNTTYSNGNMLITNGSGTLSWTTAGITPSDTAAMLANYVRRVLAGTNVTVDNTNPQYPIVSASGTGSGITKAYAPLIVSSGGDSISRRYNVLTYGADPTGVSDATTAIQAAINAASAAGGGEVFFPKGTYLVGGAINATYNSQLYIPVFGSSSASRTHIKLMGEAPPNLVPVGGGPSGGATMPIASSPVIIKSSLTTFTTAGQAVIGTALAGGARVYNQTFLSVENIAIQIKNNPGGNGPVVGGISYKNGPSLQCKNVAVYIDTAGYRSVLPRYDIAGIESPDNSAETFNIFESTLVVGFRSGYKIGEHVALIQCETMTCYYGFNLKEGHHTSTSLRTGAYWCAYDVYVSGFCTLAGFQMDTEWLQQGKWFDDVTTIVDSANLAKGQLFYTVVQGGVGVDNTKFTVSGATNLHYAANETGIASLGSNTYTKNGTLSQTFNQTGTTATTNLIWQRSGVSKFSLGMDLLGASSDNFFIYDHATTKAKLYIPPTTGELYLGGNAGASNTAGVSISNAGDVGMGNNTFYYSVARANVGIGTAGAAQTSMTLELKNPNPYLAINSSTSRQAALFYQQNGTNKWQFGMDFPNNGTADFYIYDQANAKVKFLSNTSGTTFIGGAATSGTTGSATTSGLNILTTGEVGFGIAATTAQKVLLPAGTTTVSPLKFTSGTNLTTPTAGSLEYNGTNLFWSPSTTRHTIFAGLAGSATLDFGSTAAQSSADLTITVTGAADGDPVVLGPINASTLTNSSFSAWVSAANTVTVRFNNYSAGAQDPASGTFNVFVKKN